MKTAEKSPIGAIVGDVIGSRYEWHNVKTRISSSLARDAVLLTTQ